jgi:hypothetical protein
MVHTPAPHECSTLRPTALAKVTDDLLALDPMDTLEPFSSLASEQNLIMFATTTFIASLLQDIQDSLLGFPYFLGYSFSVSLEDQAPLWTINSHDSGS